MSVTQKALDVLIVDDEAPARDELAFLLLRQHQKRDDGRLFAAFGIFLEPLLRRCRIRPVEGEGCWLDAGFCETAD